MVFIIYCLNIVFGYYFLYSLALFVQTLTTYYVSIDEPRCFHLNLLFCSLS